jgi:hypothetical protein
VNRREILAKIATERKEANDFAILSYEKSDDKKARWRLSDELGQASLLKQFFMTEELIQVIDLLAKQMSVLASLKAWCPHPAGAPEFCDVFLEA